MATAVTDAWPSIANTLTAPLRSVTLSSRRADGPTAISQRSNEPTPARQQVSLLPDFLRDSTTHHQLLPRIPRAMAATSIRTSISQMSRVGLRAANPIVRQPFFQPQSPSSHAFIRTFMRSGFGPASGARSISIASRFGPQFRTMRTQQRGFGSSNGGISRNQLATAEESANRNPGNGNLQNAFYQLLLRANMPGILVERYQSGRFATSPATEEAYKKALAALNAGTNAAANSVTPSNYARGIVTVLGNVIIVIAICVEPRLKSVGCSLTHVSSGLSLMYR